MIESKEVDYIFCFAANDNRQGIDAECFSARGLLPGSAGSLPGSARSCLGSERPPLRFFEIASRIREVYMNLHKYHLGVETSHKVTREVTHRIPADRNKLSSIPHISS